MPEALRPDLPALDGAGSQELLAISREIEAIASRAAEEIEAVFFAYAKALRARAGEEGSAKSDVEPLSDLRRTTKEL